MISFYTDKHVKEAIVWGLRRRGVDVLMAKEDGADQTPDPELLDRATALGRALFTQDEDFLAEAARRQRLGIPFNGIVYSHQMGPGIGECIVDLEIVAHAMRPEELANTVLHLPLSRRPK